MRDRALAVLVFFALALAGPALAAESVVLYLQPQATQVDITLDAFGTATEPLNLSGTVTADISLDMGGTFVESIEITGGSLGAVPDGPLVVSFGDGYGPGGGPHVALTMTTTPVTAVPSGTPQTATQSGPGTSFFPMNGLAFDLTNGTYAVTGQAFQQAVNFNVDFSSLPFHLTLSSGSATLVYNSVDQSLELQVPVVFSFLVFFDPVYVPVRLDGQMVFSTTAPPPPVPALGPAAPLTLGVAFALSLAWVVAWRRRGSRAH